MTTGEIDPRYGDASATPPPWADIERLLTDAQLYWIITVRTDGRRYEEKTSYSLVDDGGVLKIDRSSVLSSRRF